MKKALDPTLLFASLIFFSSSLFLLAVKLPIPAPGKKARMCCQIETINQNTVLFWGFFPVMLILLTMSC